MSFCKWSPLLLLFPLFCAAENLCEQTLTRGPWDSARNAKLADLLIQTGIDFRPGENVVIRSELAQKPFAEDLAKELKRRGAKDVINFYYPDYALTKRAIAEGISPEDYARFYVPENLVNRLIEEKYSSIRLMGSNETGTPAGYDPEVFSRYDAEVQKAIRPYVRHCSRDHLPWTLLELPTQTQATLAIPELPADQALQTFQEMVANVFWLNDQSPSQKWIENTAKLEARAKILNQLKLKKLHYQASGTDFTVELHPEAFWKGGRHYQASGHRPIANFPGFENFVTPKYKSTQGQMTVQRPVEVMGTLVKGAWFKFNEGQVVDYGATEGKEALTRYFAQDPRNRYLGEIALVDFDSPVLQQKRLFYSIVFDENALSHVALGAGYRHTFTRPPVTEEEIEALEMNSDQTKWHTDFMIGTSDMRITGETADGQTVLIMKDGRIALW